MLHFLSIPVDEATYVATKEQLSVIVRMDKEESVIERLQLLYHQWLRVS